MPKASVFGQMSEFPSTVIKNVVQTLRQSDKCFCQYQFWCKNVNFVQKKIEILGEMLTFSLSVHYY